MSRLSGLQVEDLRRAVLEVQGFKVAQAKPERRRIQKGHEVEYDNTNDLMDLWDLIGTRGSELPYYRHEQVKTDREDASTAMVTIVDEAPDGGWPTGSESVFAVPVYERDPPTGFRVWTLRYETPNPAGVDAPHAREPEPRWVDGFEPVPDPDAVLARADTSLDEASR